MVCATLQQPHRKKGALNIFCWKVLPGWDDDTSCHVTMTLATIQSGRRDLKAQQGHEKPSWEFTWRFSVAFNVDLPYKRARFSTASKPFGLFFFLVKQTVWNEMKYYRRWILKLQVVIGKVKKCISKHKRTTYFVYIDMPLDTAYVKAL